MPRKKLGQAELITLKLREIEGELVRERPSPGAQPQSSTHRCQNGREALCRLVSSTPKDAARNTSA